MNQQRKSLRIGITALLCAAAIRFLSPQMLEPILHFFTQPDTVAFLIYAETGRDVRFSSSGEVLPEVIPAGNLSYVPESHSPELPRWITPAFPDPSILELSYACGYRPDLNGLLQAPLDWDLVQEEPTVLIYHTHTTESYQKFQQDYEETAPFRTLDPHYNVLAIGNRVAELLEAEGIHVIHDQEVHDYPSYNTSYMHSRLAMQKLLKENPSIVLALDIHRDAGGSNENQLRTEANVGGRTAAQLMIVVGTNCRLPHRTWQDNLSLGLKLQAQLATQTPGIVRPLSLRPQRFNQDLCPGALLVEVGAAGNSLGEAMLAAEQLAQGITAISKGTTPCITESFEDSTADPGPAPGSDPPE